jgi:hypothetical protein
MMSVDIWTGAEECVSWGELSICCQLGSGTVPMILFHFPFGECAHEPFDASKLCFDDVFMALGLQQTSPAQFLVTVASCVVPHEELCDHLGDTLREYRSNTSREMTELLGGDPYKEEWLF